MRDEKTRLSAELTFSWSDRPVREADPAKQGLKRKSVAALGDVPPPVREADPAKQGLKPGAFE
ncbi:MAG: hypothetical protein ONB15_07810, partial [candidate division KSB1 bacterium]|nr:hypothetical protein [candidate division KSB1 bacterium]